ncbi:MAG: signal recognition particle-docking protein FtsY [Pseudomonadota bacterium]
MDVFIEKVLMFFDEIFLILYGCEKFVYSEFLFRHISVVLFFLSSFLFIISLICYFIIRNKKYKPLFGQSKIPKDHTPKITVKVSVEAKDKLDEVASLDISGESTFNKLVSGLSKTRSFFTSRLNELLGQGSKVDDELFEKLEEVLITSDIGVSATDALISSIREYAKQNENPPIDDLKMILKTKIKSILNVETQNESALEIDQAATNAMKILVVVGVNGSGKTTTIAKLANKIKAKQEKVLLVAADTYRAAAIQQLEIWAQRIGVEISKGKEGADPSSVIFDALKKAKDEAFDTVIIDTAGRLHTKINLMEELSKIFRVIQKANPESILKTALVIDSTNGQNAIVQAKEFKKASNVDFIILTKLDGTAKGGVIVSIAEQLKIPIKYIGIGEKMDDLRDFISEDFVEALFS